jgi:hypothetical protein
MCTIEAISLLPPSPYLHVLIRDKRTRPLGRNRQETNQRKDARVVYRVNKDDHSSTFRKTMCIVDLGITAILLLG